MNDNELANAFNVGYRLLNGEDLKVPGKDIEALATFKNLLRAILEGQLILATPDRVKPEREETPTEMIALNI